MGNGFGDANNACVTELWQFKGNLYAGTLRKAGTGAAQVWRSANGSSWSYVAPSLPSTAEEITTMVSTLFEPGYLFFGTRDSAGPALYRSDNGTSWTHVNGAGSSGWVAGGNTQIGGGMALFSVDTNLYFGTRNADGAQIWRVPMGGNSFTKVFDFNGTGTRVDIVTCLYEWNRVLYAGTHSTSGARIYSSTNGTTWTPNSGAGIGFGSNRNVAIAAMAEFQGQLHASTRNSNTGGQLWRTANGSTWTQIIDDGFGTAANVELHLMSLAFGELFVTTTTLNDGSSTLAQVWRTSDGTNYVQSNTSGFGQNSNKAGFPTLASFGQLLFWGGQNLTTGGQIWSTVVPPVIKVAPGSRTNTVGGFEIFIVQVAGSEPMSFQWYYNGFQIFGETSESLLLFNLNPCDSGAYHVVVSNPAGSTATPAANLTVICPTISLSPSTLPNATLNVPYSQQITPSGGTAPYVLQAPSVSLPPGLTMAPSGVLSGTPTSAGTYTFPVFATDDCNCSGSRNYTVMVSSPATPPSITQQPASLVVTQGNSATFSVTASGSAPLSYQWRFNGGNIGGANGTSYNIPSAQPANAGNYTVVVSNNNGSVTSQVATLTVRVPPSITQQPASLVVTQGNSATFSVTATGDAPLSYQWRLNGGNIGGANGTSYNIPSAQPANAGNYTVVVSNNSGSVTSQVATLTVNCPAISLSPTTLAKGMTGMVYNQTITASGGTAPYTFNVTAGSLPPGLTLSAGGTLSGTPTAGGAQNFTITATDSSACQGSQAYTLSVVVPPVIQSITVSGSDVVITWQAVAGARYRLRYTDSLDDLDWANLSPDITASGPTASKTEPITGATRFYQVVLLD
jgi:hypothetical protein